MKLRATELEASKVRSRAPWLKDSEKPSKFFKISLLSCAYKILSSAVAN